MITETRTIMSRSSAAVGSIHKNKGSGAIKGKMLLLSIIENNKVYAYFRSG